MSSKLSFFVITRHLLPSSSQLTTDTDVESDSREQEPESSLESAGPSGDALFPLETSPLFPELQGDGSLSSEVFFNVLCLGPSRKRKWWELGGGGGW